MTLPPASGCAVLVVATFLFGVALHPSAARADREYWGIDVSESTQGGVLSATRGEFTFGTSVTDYGDGVSAGLSLSRRIPFTFGVSGLTLSAGAAVAFGGGDLSEVEFGVTGSAQRFVPTKWGSYFLQASVGSNSQNFFLQAQVTFAEPGLTVGLSRGGSTEYNETGLSISKRLGDSPVSLRTGYGRFSLKSICGAGPKSHANW